MQLKHSLILAGASHAAAQNITDALASQPQLSTLTGLLGSMPDIAKTLGSKSGITLLALNNDALARFLNSSGPAVAAAPDSIAAILNYHVLNGTYYASNFTSATAPLFIPTLLDDRPAYVNVTGGQRVEAMVNNGTVRFFSGLGDNSTVTQANVNFTGGTIHVIDKVLTVPLNDSATLIAANLTAAAGALTQAGLGMNVSQARDVTIFAPNNAAFNAIGNLAANLSTQQLGSLLEYHVIAGTVAYSSSLSNMTATTLSGQNITITVINQTVFVNSAKVIAADVLVNNGVVHVLDNVLNPANSTVAPNPTGSNAPAFSGASTASGGSTPFTSGVPAPTSTAPVATRASGSPSSSTGGAAAPMRTGAMGAAALFGGAAIFVNL